MNISRLFTDSVILTKLGWGDSRGAAAPNSATSNPARASVQPMRSSRRLAFDFPAGETAFSVYFPTDPGLGTDDRILWRDRTLRVLAPARDQAGWGVVWAIDAVETEGERP